MLPHTDVPLARPPEPVPPPAPVLEATAMPAGGEADVALPRVVVPENSRRADLGAAVGGPRLAGNLPVLLSPGGAESMRVRVADQAATQRAGVSGVLISLTPTGPGSGTTAVSLDYRSFRNAGGASFGSRLRLVTLPQCALTTPQVADCQVQTPVPSHNDASRQLVSGSVSSETPTVLAAVAGDSGPNGTFTASSLAPSGTWSVSGNSGAFGWSYPITVPPAATGGSIAPKIALGYSSSSVDGQTSGTNNQSSWIGEGWNYSPGFIERTYRPCSADDTLPVAQQTPDLCWAGQIVTMNLGGQSMPLVYDDHNHIWRPGDDNGSRVGLMTGAVNGALNGEHWRITTTDGVQYWFGRHRGPGYANEEQTNSTWTVPVYGPRVTDPCYNPAGFAQSSCTQAWRWNLDYVEDPHGNATVYYYAAENNHYGANKGTAGVPYIRGGAPVRIDYGLRKKDGSIYGQIAPRQVVFSLIERCVPDAGFTCDPAQFTAANKDRWPDTPQDQQCLAGAVCNNHAPSFWSTKRLSTITTQYNVGAGPVRVDSYQLAQSFPPTTTVSDRELGLDSIVRTGFDPSGASISLPATRFTSQLLHNRVPGYNGQPAMAHWRMTNVYTDTGSQISVSYSQPECGPGNFPTDNANNTKRCFPVFWTQPFQTEPTQDYFHKYVVDRVNVQDPNAISPSQVTRYSYLGTPAWHFDDNEVVKPKHRTYGQFRGYEKVEIRTGDPARAGDQTTLTRTTYFRGMDGDILPGGGSRPATVPNSLGESVPDNNLYAGAARETQTFNGDNGPQLSTEVTDQLTVATSATRTRTGLRPLTANVVQVGKTRAITTLAAGGTRITSTTRRYDNLGRVVASTDSGDGVPDLCTTTRYADNSTSWIRDRVSETLTSQQICPAEGVPPAPVLSAANIYYDGATTLGAVPGPGDATRTEKATANTNGVLTFATMGTVAYDPAGRPTSATDALNRSTATTYSPTDGGLLSKVVTTNAKSQTSSVDMEPSRGLTTKTLDVGGRRHDATYDPLGRLTAVWQPGRLKGTNSANITYAYVQRIDVPLAVTTKTLVDYGTGTNYVTSINLYDHLGQLRQTQADDTSDRGGVQRRVVKDIFYDSHGWAITSNNRYTTTGVPSTTLIQVADSAVDDRTVSTYDGAGRVTKATAYRGLTATWDTRTVYGGDRTTVFPPQGAVTSTTLVDARGKTTELRQYTAAPTVSGSVVSGGSFQASSYRYTVLGQLDQLRDTAGNTWTYGFDFLGRQTTATDPDSGARTSTFDLAGQLTSTTDARGQTLSYEYDPLGRKTSEWSGTVGTGTKLAAWGYDADRPHHVGLLTSTTRFTPAGNYDVFFTYNGAGRLSSHLIRIPASETGFGGVYSTRYGYHSTGLLFGVDLPMLGGLPSEGIGISYDRHGQPQNTSGYNTIVSSSAYTPYGEPSQYSLGVNNSTGTLSFARDAQTRRVTGVNLSVTQAFPQVDDLRYSYDPAGNLTRIVNVQGDPNNGAPTRTECYTYDTLDRLSQAWTATDNCGAAPSAATVGGPTPYWSSWTFDPIGLRKTQVRHGVPGAPGDTTTTYTYPPSGPTAVRPHALSSTSTTGPAGTSTTNYGYNPAGDTTSRTLPAGNQTLAWTEHNRLASVTTPTGTTSYVYDADGNQLIRRDPGSTTLYLPGQEIRRDHTTGTLTGTRYYTHNGTVVALRVGGANISYVQADLHGTTQVAVKAEAIDNHTVSRRSFDPYGNPLGAGLGVWPDQHGFLNKPHNPATGLSDVGARTYDPTTATFQSPDPILDPADPHQWPAYTYAANNPTTFADPTGLKYYVDDNNATIPRLQGHDQSDDPVVARADDRAHANTRVNAKAKWKSPIRNRGGQTVPREAIDGLRASWGYTGSDDFTYLDGLVFAAQGRAQWGIVCQWMVGSAEQCKTHDDGIGAVHALLDFVGLVPGFGEPADGFNALLYLGEGHFADAAISGLSVIPGIGDAAKASRLGSDTNALSKAFCSFTGDTEVLMADNTHKPIKDIQVGDQVLTTNPETGEQGPRTVTATLTHQDTVIDLQVEDGATVTTTEDHPFYNATDKTWQRADQLNPGDQLLTAEGARISIIGLRIGIQRTTVAYNLTVQGIHTYHVLVGRAAVLVHNDCGSYVPSGAAADFDFDELAQLAYQHVGAGDIAGRPSLDQIRKTLDAVPYPLSGQNAVQFERSGVRVIINEDQPWRSTAYFIGK